MSATCGPPHTLSHATSTRRGSGQRDLAVPWTVAGCLALEFLVRNTAECESGGCGGYCDQHAERRRVVTDDTAPMAEAMPPAMAMGATRMRDRGP